MKKYSGNSELKDSDKRMSQTMVHSDRGYQYTSQEFKCIIDESKMTQKVCLVLCREMY